MLHSMTGFSRVRREFPWGTLTIELQSVNSRYLETHVRTDRTLTSFEPLIQNSLRAKLARGKVRVQAGLVWAPSMMKPGLNLELLRGYYTAVAALADEMGAPVPSLERMMNLPGVTSVDSFESTTCEELNPAVADVLDDAISGLKSMRAEEGKAMEADLRLNLGLYRDLVSKIASSWKEIKDTVFAEYRERITGTIEQLGFKADEARLAQELVTMADKWDISEELTRSASHAGQFEGILDKGGVCGRKLDFLVQEMNREMNTIGSKSASTELRWLVVEGKTVIERLREQIQNVE